MTKGKNPSKSTKTRVLIVDRHPIMRQGMVSLINAQSDLVVCGEAKNGPEGLAAVETLKPDLVVIDITMKGMNGIALIKRIRQQGERCLIMVLSMRDETSYAERALRAGARSYIVKQEVRRGDVLKAIRKVLDGEIWVSEAMANRLISKIAAGGEMTLASVKASA